MTDVEAPIIAGFEVLKKLGRGGMSTVWMARQLSLDRIVAVKVLLPRFALDEDEVARFRSEAQAAAKLKHSGIVQVYDTSVTGGSYYFIMEYIAGYTVGDWVRRKGVLPERDAVLVAEHVSDALGYAWDQANIIHCDIKPDNVMIDEDGTVKVTDLGLSRTLNAMSSFEEDDGYVLGTPAYMAPEQARGDAHLDFRSDIYSLGAMLYHLVTGKRLFYEHDDNETLELQIVGTAPDAMELNPSLSRPVCALIERMLAKNPDLRGESWQAVHADIRRVYSGIMPHHCLHDDDMSTMARCEQRMEIDHERLHRLTSEQPRKPSVVVWAALWASIAAVGIAVAVKLYITFSTPSRPQTVPTGHSPTLPQHQEQSNTDAQPASPKEHFDAALAWQQANPSDTEGAISRYQDVIRQTQGTPYASRAETRIRMLQREQEQLAKAVITPAMNDAAQAIIDGRLDLALDKIRPLRRREDLSWYHDSLRELQICLESLYNADFTILETFRSQQGETLEVGLKSGHVLLTIGDIQNGQLQCFKHDAYGDLEDVLVSAKDLSPTERATRLGMENKAAAAIENGLQEYRAGNFHEAAQLFRETHFLIADPLVALAERPHTY
jgi:serine/threonine protein kinase